VRGDGSGHAADRCLGRRVDHLKTICPVRLDEVAADEEGVLLDRGHDGAFPMGSETTTVPGPTEIPCPLVDPMRSSARPVPRSRHSRVTSPRTVTRSPAVVNEPI